MSESTGHEHRLRIIGAWSLARMRIAAGWPAERALDLDPGLVVACADCLEQLQLGDSG